MNKFVPPQLFCCQNPLYPINKTKNKRNTSFEKAVALTGTFEIDPNNQTLILLYSLYKQATEGDINIAPPDVAGDPLAHARYQAWLSLKGKSTKAARAEYIKLVKNLKI